MLEVVGSNYRYHTGSGGRTDIYLRRFPVDTLMVRKIDDLGRVVVPAETRRLFNIHEGDALAITVENGGIVLRKLEASCAFCGSSDDLKSFKDRGVCAECRTALAAI